MSVTEVSGSGSVTPALSFYGQCPVSGRAWTWSFAAIAEWVAGADEATLARLGVTGTGAAGVLRHPQNAAEPAVQA
jgi:hypothetical protein